MSEEHVHGPDCDHDHDDEDGLELIRVRLVGEELHCSLLPEAFDDPASWGVVLADLARNIADSSTPEGTSSDDLLQQIRTNFLAALDERPDDTLEE